jgi:hypothetical protein
MWRQRSRDKNTTFFHQKASRRRARNKIVKLIKADVSECTNVNEMHRMAVDYYQNLFNSEGTSNMHRVLDRVPRKVTDEMNHYLFICSV